MAREVVSLPLDSRWHSNSVTAAVHVVGLSPSLSSIGGIKVAVAIEGREGGMRREVFLYNECSVRGGGRVEMAIARPALIAASAHC